MNAQLPAIHLSARLLTVIGIVAAAVITPMFFGGILTHAQQITFGIFLLAALLWLTEVIPPFATAITIIVLQVFLLGRPGGPLELEEEGLTGSYQIFINPVASPVIVLFFGGFVLAAAAGKYGMDRLLARHLLKPFSGHPRKLLLGVILVTAVFSMFMSNTATAVMMLAILSPFLAAMAPGDPFRKGLTFGVAFAANLGGMGTLIGTPPNAVAASILGSMGYSVSFIGWMLVGVPLTAVMLTLLWVLLMVRFPAAGELNTVPDFGQVAPSRSLTIVLGTFGVTVLLWMTEPLHGMPAPVVALVPVLVFTTCGILTAADLKRLDWDVLLLVAGGLSLGVALQHSGLSARVVELLPLAGVPPFFVAAALVLGAMVLSNFMSNTSAANILIPMAATLGVFSPMAGAMLVAFAASMAMSLPISTPPNAVAYGKGVLTTRDLVRTGTLVSCMGYAVLLGLFWILAR